MKIFYRLLVVTLVLRGFGVSAQNVGIGTATPVQKLEIAGTTNTIRIDGLVSGGTFNAAATSSANIMYVNANGDIYSLPAGGLGSILCISNTGVPTWSTSATSATAWQLTGNIGTTPGTNFIGTTDATDFVFKTDGTERMRIGGTSLDAGYIGINTLPVSTQQLTVSTATTANTGIVGSNTVASATGNSGYGVVGIGSGGAIAYNFTIASGPTLNMNAGVFGSAVIGPAVPASGTSNVGFGVIGMLGTAFPTSSSTFLPGAGVLGTASSGGTGVAAYSSGAGIGVYASSTGGGIGVSVNTTGGGDGISVTSTGGAIGVLSNVSSTGTGVEGNATGNNGIGVEGTSSSGGAAIYGKATGTNGQSSPSPTGGYGVFATGSSNAEAAIYGNLDGGSPLPDATVPAAISAVYAQTSLSGSWALVANNNVSASPTNNGLLVFGTTDAVGALTLGSNTTSYFTTGGVKTAGSLVFDNGSSYATTINANASATGSYTLTLPPAQATSAGQVLSNNGSGVLSWANPSSGSVTSVGMTVPSAFSVTPSTITSSGTFTVTATGTTSQYIDGTGSLQTFPTSLAPAGAAGGDLGGTYPSPTVIGLEGIGIIGTPVSGQVLEYNGTNWVPTVAATGSVTSVGLTMPSIFTVGGSPVTTTGTLSATLNNETANTIFAGPTSGGAATPTFRTLVAADIPSLAGSYIQNQSTASQTANFYISGNAGIGAAPVTAQQLTIGITSGGTGISVTASGNGVGVSATGSGGGTGVLGSATGNTGSFNGGYGVEGEASSGGTGVWANSSGQTNATTPLGGFGVFATGTYNSQAGVYAFLNGVSGGTPSPHGTTIPALGAIYAQTTSTSSTTTPNAWAIIANNSGSTTPTNNGLLVFGTTDAVGTVTLGSNTTSYFTTGGAKAAGSLVFDNGSSYATTINANASATGSYTLTLPPAQATSAGQVLTNDGAGNLSWASASSSLSNLTNGTGISTFTYNGGSPVTVSLANTTVTAGSYGDANDFTTFTVNAQGQLTAAGTEPLPTSLPPTGTAGGDLGNMYPNPTVVGIEGIGISGVPTSNGQVLEYNGTNWVPTVAATGSVTSVGLTMPSIFTVGGSPVTTTGTLSTTLNNETANTIFAGPTSGGAATPTFRALIAADIPSLAGNYIQNQNSAAQTANFYINGNASIGIAPVSTQQLTVSTATTANTGIVGSNTVASATGNSGYGVVGIGSGGAIAYNFTIAGGPTLNMNSGVFGSAVIGPAVPASGTSNVGFGVIGMLGTAFPTSSSTFLPGAGVLGTASSGGTGVAAYSSGAGIGVYASSTGGGIGVSVNTTGGGDGISVTSTGGAIGVLSNVSSTGTGVEGNATGNNGIGVEGTSSSGGAAIYGKATGTNGQSSPSPTGGYGVFATGSSNAEAAIYGNLDGGSPLPDATVPAAISAVYAQTSLSGSWALVANNNVSASPTNNGLLVFGTTDAVGTVTLGSNTTSYFTTGGAKAAGSLVFDNGSFYATTINANASATGSYALTLPPAQATSAGQVLTNDGAGNLSWASASSSLSNLTNGTGINTFAYNGSSPVTVALANTTVTAGGYGDANDFTTFTVNAQGQLTVAGTEPLPTSLPPTGTASGDLSGSYPNPTVAAINGVGLGSTAATAGNLLIGSGSQWVSTALSGDATVTSGGAVTVGGLQGISITNTAPTNGQVLEYNGTNWTPTAPTLGTVTSIGLSVPGSSIFGVTGSPVTDSGTIGITTTGTSGGIPYFNSTSTLASSAALTQYGIVYGGGAGTAPATTAAGSIGQILQSNGTSAPTWTTATFPAATTVNQLLYSSATNTVTGLATANNAVLTTNSTGVPTWSNSGMLNNIQVIKSGTSYTPTLGTNIAVVELIGGGGGGGGTSAAGSNASAGGGGGSGGYVKFILSNPSGTYTVAIGGGGAGGTGGNGTVGNNTTFTVAGTTYTAGGGGGGIEGNANYTSPGGAGGTNSGGSPLLSVSGSPGGNSVNDTKSYATSGQGASSILGGGGVGVYLTTTGGPITGNAGATNSGAGGGGGIQSGEGVSATGGAGGSGVIIITEYK